MPEIVNIHAAKTHLSQLLERVHQGEEIILAKNGKPYARLVPLDAPTKAPRELGGWGEPLSLQSETELLRSLSDEELEAWQ